MSQVHALKTAGTKKSKSVSYAGQQNSKFNSKKSHYLDIKDRFNTLLSLLPALKQQGIRAALMDACNKFQKKFPHVKKWEDLNMVEATYMPLSDLLIDVTIQRLLSFPWVFAILSNFKEVQAMPIQVYPVSSSEKIKYLPHGSRGIHAAWEGQHTLAVFYIIAVMILKLDPKTVMIPVNVYPMSKKSEIRETFVAKNGTEGTKLLDAVDLYQQMIYGVRVDGNTNPTWAEAEQKQQYIEQADLFVTADKFGDTNMPGAISRMQEINGYNSEVIRQFCMYTTTIPISRPIASQEIEIMCAWFDMARKGGIDYTDAEIVDLGNHLQHLFLADFQESSPFWVQARTAYTNWHNEYYKNWDYPPTLRFNKNWSTGGVFLWHQLRKTWPGRVPKLSITSPFVPNKDDLYK